MKPRDRWTLPPFSDAEALLRLVPEQLPTIVYIYDLDTQRNLYANQRFTQVLGYPVVDSQRPGSTLIPDHLHPDDQPVIERAIRKYATAADGETVITEMRFRAATGEWKWLRCRDTVFARHANGKPHLILGTAIDITLERESEQKLREQQQKLDRERLRLHRLLELNDRERRLMAYDIHDGFVQEVVSAQLAIDAMLDRLASVDPESVAALLRVRGIVRKAMDEARRVVNELRPATSDDTGLVEAIQFLVNEAEAIHHVHVTFSPPKTFERLSPLLERSLVRIVQESLSNVRRHAQTNRAEIRLQRQGDTILLEIEDAGVGFDPDAVPPGHFGLEGIRERASAFGGQTTIRSRPRKGTLVRVEVPIEKGKTEMPKKPRTTKPKSARGAKKKARGKK